MLCGTMSGDQQGPTRQQSSQQDLGSCLLLALCGEKHDLEIREVPLSGSVQQDVVSTFLRQEAAFRKAEEKPFDENWLNDGDEIATTTVPKEISVFEKIFNSADTELEPIDSNLEKIRGLAMKARCHDKKRILVQVFAKNQSLSREGIVALLSEDGTYTRLKSSTFCLADKLVCIFENDLIKFRSLHNLSRVIDTSAIFSVATDNDVKSFAETHTNLFEISDVSQFVNYTSRNARKYMMSLVRSDILQSHTAQTLKDAAINTQLQIHVQNDKIVMPSKSGEITELMRFLNDGRYVGPISGQAFIANSRKLVN